MNPNPKSTKAPAPAAEPVGTAAEAFPVALAGLYNRGVERLVATQKTALDLASRQNADLLDVCQRALPAASTMPALLFDMAGQAFENFLENQKRVLDAFAERNAALLAFSRQRTSHACQCAAPLTQLAEESVERGTFFYFLPVFENLQSGPDEV